MAAAPTASTIARNSIAESFQVIYQAENVYRKVKGNGKHGTDEQVYGSFALKQKVNGHHIEWSPSHTHIMKLDSYEGGEDWGIVNGVGYRNSSNGVTIDEEPGAGQQLYTKSPSAPRISFNVEDLHYIKMSSKSLLNHSSLEFSLADGTKHEPIFFQDGGTRDIIRALDKIVILRRSGAGTYYIDRNAPAALDRSLKELKLYNNTQQAVSRFLRNPVQATFSGFAKVHKVLTEALVTPPPDELEVDPMLSAEIMRMSAQENGEVVIPKDDEAVTSVPIDTCRVEEPDYAFVDESLNLSERIDMPRGPKLTKEIWRNYLDEDGKCIHPDVIRHIIFRGGISTEIRPELWKFLLDMYPWTSTSIERDELRNEKVKRYFSMKLQWKSIDTDQESRWSIFSCHKQLIEKDVNRTDRTSAFYRGDGNPNLVFLNDILMTYVMYNMNLGYVQGMSDLLSPLLMVLENEVDAFWCFAGFMNIVGSNFAEDQSGMKLQLSQLNLLVQILDKDLFNFLESKESGNMYFAFRWLLIVFKREFTMDDIFKLWEVYWTRLPCTNYQLLIALDMLLRQKETLIGGNMDFTDILKHINELSTRLSAEEILMSSESLANQLIRCKNLPDDISSIFGLPCAAERKANTNYII